MKSLVRVPVALGSLLIAATFVTPASAEPHPTIAVPAGWTLTHEGGGDTTWKRDGEQLHVKRYPFRGTLDALVETILAGMRQAEPDAEATTSPEKTCGDKIAGRRIVVRVGSGDDQVFAEMILVSIGDVGYAASYLRKSSDPDRAEAHAALRTLCIAP